MKKDRIFITAMVLACACVFSACAGENPDAGGETSRAGIEIARKDTTRAEVESSESGETQTIYDNSDETLANSIGAKVYYNDDVEKKNRVTEETSEDPRDMGTVQSDTVFTVMDTTEELLSSLGMDRQQLTSVMKTLMTGYGFNDVTTVYYDDSYSVEGDTVTVAFYFKAGYAINHFNMEYDKKDGNASLEIY